MAEHEGQPGSDGAPAVTDDTLRLYLLCRLEEDERLRLDERLLADDKLAERIGLAASELTDDYVGGRLDLAEREAYAKGFLVTDERRRQLSFTSALQDYSRSQAAASASVIAPRTGPSWREGFASIFSPGRPVWAIAGSFAVLILFVGLTWFIAKQRDDSMPLIAKHESPIPALSPQGSPQGSIPRPADSPSARPTPARKPEAVASPAEPPTTIASFILLPGAVRGNGKLARVAVPGGKRDVVRLSLVFEGEPASGEYRAELATVEEQVVSELGKLKPESGNRVVVPIPARLLQSGDYQITLTRRNAAGQTETVGRYYFRALRK